MTTTTPRTSAAVDVLSMIQRLREVNHACTAGALARQMRYSKTHITNVCQALKDAGLVDWTTMPGSVHLTEAGLARTQQGPSHVAVVVTQQSHAEPAGDTRDQQDAETDSRQRQKEALARGRAKVAANRAARQAAGESGHV